MTYKYFMQEYFRTYDNPLDEDISKTIISYLKFYNYIPIGKSKRFSDRSYQTKFSNSSNIAVLHFGENMATLVEYDSLTETTPRVKMDFIKKERLEYLGSFRDKCLVYTFDKYRKCYYYGPVNYQGMSDNDYYNNKIKEGTKPNSKIDNSDIVPVMMRIIASADYANEIRCLREKEDTYCGKQIKR